jgi:hypothetical protein
VFRTTLPATPCANTHTWNAESEIKSAAGVNYTYDGEGSRLEKSSGNVGHPSPVGLRKLAELLGNSVEFDAGFGRQIM